MFRFDLNLNNIMKDELKLNIGKATYYSFLFLWIYTPFFCCENILTDIMKKNGFESLGFELIAVLYLFQLVGGIFSPSICNKIGLKSSAVSGSLALSFFVIVNILPAWR